MGENKKLVIEYLVVEHGANINKTIVNININKTIVNITIVNRLILTACMPRKGDTLSNN